MAGLPALCDCRKTFYTCSLQLFPPLTDEVSVAVFFDSAPDTRRLAREAAVVALLRMKDNSVSDGTGSGSLASERDRELGEKKRSQHTLGGGHEFDCALRVVSRHTGGARVCGEGCEARKRIRTEEKPVQDSNGMHLFRFLSSRSAHVAATTCFVSSPPFSSAASPAAAQAPAPPPSSFFPPSLANPPIASPNPNPSLSLQTAQCATIFPAHSCANSGCSLSALRKDAEEVRSVRWWRLCGYWRKRL